MKKESVVIALIFFLIGGGVGAGVFSVIKKCDNDNFELGWEQAKQRLIENNYLIEDLDNEAVYQLNGEIQKIEEGKIYLSTYPLNPLADANLNIRIVEVDKDTLIVEHVTKDMDIFNKEEQEFLQKLEKGEVDYSNSPIPFILKEVLISELRVGVAVNVIAEENIRDKKQFKAIKMIVDNSALDSIENY